MSVGRRRKKVVIAGASGLVGLAAVRHFAQLDDWDVVGLSRRIPAEVPGATLVSVDLTDRQRCAALARDLADTTHLIYAALYEKPGLVEGWQQDDQMQTNLGMMQNLFDPLHAVAKGLKHVSLLQGTKAYGVHIAQSPVPARERWPRHPHRNFYFLQEDYLRDKQAGRAWSWTIFRPQVIFGESLGSPMNLIPAIGVYAALLRDAGHPLWYPGGAASVSEAVDADLLARALSWAATSPVAGTETFNITNGDTFSWPDVWHAIAGALGMEPGGNRPLRLAVEMPKRAEDWAAIVDKHRLRSPRSMGEFVGDSFIYADALFGYGRDTARFPQLVSTIKIRQAGFGDCIDTEDMFAKWFGRFQRRRLLPPL
jgi:nucleoside-diphosphate-sugar epimerase